MFKKAKKRAITLVEMMIVMFLIAMITGVIAYNYSGSLEEGKYFKTKTGIEKLQTVISMHMAENPNDNSDWKDMVRASPLVKNANELIKDGWGKEYDVDIKDGEALIISTSPKFMAMDAKKQHQQQAR